MGCGASAPTRVGADAQAPMKENLSSRDARDKRELSGSTVSLDSFDSRRPSLEGAEDLLAQHKHTAYMEKERRTSFSDLPNSLSPRGMDNHHEPAPLGEKVALMHGHKQAMLHASAHFEPPDLSKTLAPGSGFEQDPSVTGVTRLSRRRGGSSHNEEAMMEAATAGVLRAVPCKPPVFGLLYTLHSSHRDPAPLPRVWPQLPTSLWTRKWLLLRVMGSPRRRQKRKIR